MDIQVKELDYCKVLVDFSASEEEISNKENQIIDLFKSAPIPGNRPGKASKKTIKSYYSKQITHSLKQAMAEEAVQQAMLEQNLKPAANPQFSSVELKPDNFTCQFTLLTLPSFELETYKGFDVPKPHSEANVSDLAEKTMQELRLKHSDIISFTEDDFVQIGDNVIVDYVGSIDGEKVENLSAEAEMFTVGTSVLQEFDQHIIGMKVGQTLEFDIVAPETALPSFKDKTIHFSVSLTMASKVFPHPLDDDMAKKEGFETLEELRAKVNEIAFGKIAFNERYALTKAVANVLVQNHSFKVPEFMLLAEAKALAASAKIDFDQLKDEDKERYMKAAEKNAKLALILNKVREEEPDAQLTDAETVKALKSNLEKMYPGQNLKQILDSMDKTGYTQMMVNRIKDEHTLEFITNTCKVIE